MRPSIELNRRRKISSTTTPSIPSMSKRSRPFLSSPTNWPSLVSSRSILPYATLSTSTSWWTELETPIWLSRKSSSFSRAQRTGWTPTGSGRSASERDRLWLFASQRQAMSLAVTRLVNGSGMVLGKPMNRANPSYSHTPGRRYTLWSRRNTPYLVGTTTGRLLGDSTIST